MILGFSFDQREEKHFQQSSFFVSWYMHLSNETLEYQKQKPMERGAVRINGFNSV